MNGRALTAQDIEYNYHRLLGLGSGFTERTIMPWELLAEANIESVTATDESTVVFKLERLTLTILPAVLNSFAGWMYPPDVIEEHGDAADWKNLVGTGPMMLTDRVEGSSVTWEKNPDYWGHDEKYPQNRLPYIDQLRALIMIEPATRLAAPRRTSQAVIQFEDWPEEVRKVFTYDPEGAKELLAKAGYPDGFKTTMIHLECYDLNYIQLLASYWKKIGVEVEIDVHPPPSHAAKRSARDFVMTNAGGVHHSQPDSGNGLGRRHHADDAHHDAGGAEAGLHPHRLVQGAEGAGGGGPARRQECPDPGGDPDRPACRAAGVTLPSRSV